MSAHTDDLSLSLKQRKHLQEQASRQEKIIAAYFNDGIKYSPSEMEELLRKEGFQWPLTSIRRSISNLTEAGLLQKLKETRDGKYGRPEHYWKWKSDRPKQQSMFGAETKMSSHRREVEGV